MPIKTNETPKQEIPTHPSAEKLKTNPLPLGKIPCKTNLAKNADRTENKIEKIIRIFVDFFIFLVWVSIKKLFKKIVQILSK